MRPLHAALRRREPVRRDERFAALRLSRAKLGRVRVAAAERRPIGPRMERYQASYRAPHLASAGVGSVMRASYYDTGRRTADGERFNPGAFTAAHKTLPFGTRLRLTNERNGRSVTVRINDRGPFVPGRSLDVTKAAAVALGMIGSGTATLRVQRV